MIIYDFQDYYDSMIIYDFPWLFTIYDLPW
jgi:hypothetical protein